MGAVRKELKRNFHGQHGGKKRDLKKNHKRSTGAMSPAFVLVKRRDQEAKRRDVLGVRQDLGKERGRKWRT